MYDDLRNDPSGRIARSMTQRAASRRGTLPSALVIGPMRAGTSWLHEYLAARGDICLPAGVKETFFFDRRRGEGADWYRAHFRHCDPDRHLETVEVAPSYFHCREAPRRISDCLGQIPLVVTLRNPVERAWSHYLHLVRYGFTSEPLRSAVEDFPEIVAASQYERRLREWREFWPAERLHIVQHRDLVASPHDYARRVCEALRIPWLDVVQELAERKVNETAVPYSSALASRGRRIANALRGRRLYPVINAAKRMGLRRIFLGGGSGRRNVPALTEEDREWLHLTIMGA